MRAVLLVTMALVARVVPNTNRSLRSSRSVTELFMSSAAAPSVSNRPITGSAGVVGRLYRRAAPPALLTTRSVNVPPVSAAKVRRAAITTQPGTRGRN